MTLRWQLPSAVFGPILAAALVAAYLPVDAGAHPARGASVPKTMASNLPQTGRMLQLFAPTYMMKTTAPYSSADAVTIAQNYDLVVANKTQFVQTIPMMKAANPNVRVLVYLNGSFDMNHTPAYASTLYARDANGNMIQSTKYHNWLMDIGNAQWAATVSGICTSLLASAPYDGCFVDMLGDALLTGKYLTSQPINPATGQVWTNEQRMVATTGIGNIVRGDHPNAIVMANGLNDGQRYFDPTAPTSQLLGGVSTALAETWLRQATRTITTYRSPNGWKQDVDLLSDVGNRGDAAAVTTKVWIPATPQQLTAWHQYALTSFLLGTTGVSYFSFTASQSPTEIQTINPLDHVKVGTPMSSGFQQQGSTFSRVFSNADVFVNPTNAPATASVTAPCTTLEGTALSSNITVAAYSGDICSFPPTVSAVSPSTGSTSGGSLVTVTGTGFGGATAVNFGSGNPASTFAVNSTGTQITATSPVGTGTVDVTVTTPAGTSSTSAADQFTYVAGPAVQSVTPATGPAAGGTSVTITGSGFSGATAVGFGSGNPAASYTVNSTGTQIAVTSPPGTGTVDVTVTTPSGTSAASAADQFTYVPAPSVQSVTPATGPAAGGTSVTITGSGFSGATAVDFGSGNPAASYTVNSTGTQIAVTSPAGTGTVDVTVTTPSGTSAASAADQFTYVPAPSVQSVTPATGPAAGGTSVTIAGSGFGGATAVDFGLGNPASSFTVNSTGTQITVTSPPGTGTVDVTVLTPSGTSATSTADQFTYV